MTRESEMTDAFEIFKREQGGVADLDTFRAGYRAGYNDGWNDGYESGQDSMGGPAA